MRTAAVPYMSRLRFRVAWRRRRAWWWRTKRGSGGGGEVEMGARKVGRTGRSRWQRNMSKRMSHVIHTLVPKALSVDELMSKMSKPQQDPNLKGSSPGTPADLELEQLLSKEASAFQREVEVERIFKAFKLK